ncbi:hypothetical protein GCM10009535_00190 [Streptomyces thermocarboxydovorans]|uniref:Galactose oxidase-like Early set domain-containing protein n=1 Tax=Streptomyces thermocarboxydovorans TaxID=59298 RepID=A0ABP3SBE3_9ACTN
MLPAGRLRRGGAEGTGPRRQGAARGVRQGYFTDVDQRSIALDLKRTKDGVTVTVPKNRNLVHSGWYMLFVVDDKGTPSKAQWVKVP